MKRPRNRKQAQPRLATGRAARVPADPAAVLSPGRKWLFRFIMVFVLPLIALGGLELGLRLLGLGFDPHFFARTNIGGQDCYVANDNFGLRFFPRSLARIPTPIVMPAAKSPDTFRIFIFGESAALGEPMPNYGAGRYLEVLLGERFPETKFEVINTSMTAINSHVILPIAEECARHAGDLWIIYMGNNEMVGPFGLATTFGMRAPPLWLLRAKLQLQRLRLVQVGLDLNQRLHPAKAASTSWHGMEMFMHSQVSPEDPRKQRVYQSYQRNLQDMLHAGQSSGAKIILSTVAVNLKDCPPFGTVSGDSLSESNRAAYEKFCKAGGRAAAQGQFVEAQSDFQRATEILPAAAEAQFQLATCLLRTTNATAALPYFLKAVDADTLPFRADSNINEAIKATAHEFGPKSVSLCDAAEALGADSANGIPGEELFYEHVHFNPRGNYALARVWASEVEKQLSPALKRNARSSWTSPSECEQLLGFTDWNQASILEVILQRFQRPPFSGQSDNAQQIARVQGEIDALQARLTSAAAEPARAVYLRALRRSPENFRLHENYAEFLEARHETQTAIAERKKVCELIPFYYFPFYSLAVDLKEAGALAEARDALLQAAALKPDQSEVRLELGTVYARQGQWESARQELETSRRLNADDPRTPLFLGEVLWKLERSTEAVAALRDAIRLAPTDWQPHYRLASDLAQTGDWAEAANEYQEALRLNPANVKTKLGLAIAFAKLSRPSEALRLLDEILMLEPANQPALGLRKALTLPVR